MSILPSGAKKNGRFDYHFGVELVIILL